MKSLEEIEWRAEVEAHYEVDTSDEQPKVTRSVSVEIQPRSKAFISIWKGKQERGITCTVIKPGGRSTTFDLNPEGARALGMMLIRSTSTSVKLGGKNGQIS